MTGRLVRDAVLPAAPQDVHPGSGEDPGGVGVGLLARWPGGTPRPPTGWPVDCPRRSRSGRRKAFCRRGNRKVTAPCWPLRRVESLACLAGATPSGSESARVQWPGHRERRLRPVLDVRTSPISASRAAARTCPTRRRPWKTGPSAWRSSCSRIRGLELADLLADGEQRPDEGERHLRARSGSGDAPGRGLQPAVARPSSSRRSTPRCAARRPSAWD